MKFIARLAICITPLATSLIVSSCAGTTTTTLPSAPSSASSSVQPVILSTNTMWTLQSLVETGSPEVKIADPSLFTVMLTDDGHIQARADCNRASAGYTLTGQTLSVGLMASTMAACATAPIDGRYLALLGGENVVTVSGAALQLSSSRGTLRFVR